jgi:hypothetical protein
MGKEDQSELERIAKEQAAASHNPEVDLNRLIDSQTITENAYVESKELPDLIEKAIAKINLDRRFTALEREVAAMLLHRVDEETIKQTFSVSTLLINEVGSKIPI